MQATINGTDKVITGKTLTDLRHQLNAMLAIDGLHGLTATTNTGATIHVELYEGQDYIRTADGRSLNLAAAALGSIRSERKAKSSAANGRKGGRPKTRRK